MTGPSSILWVHVGAPCHGVHRFGRLLATARGAGASTAQVHLPDPSAPDAPERLDRARRAWPADVVVLQFTDHQWGADPVQALARFEQVADGLRPAALVVGLHDVPRSDEPRRRAAYLGVAGRADRVVVCSEHERRRLGEPAGDLSVVPHPVEWRRPRHPSGGGSGGEVAVLGFVYPGKGHGDVVDGTARSSSRPPVLAIGGAAPGHEGMLPELVERAAGLGVAMRATGWVSDEVLVARAARAAVPVVPNCAPSASGSLATWLSVGRRPLVRDSAYAREVAELVPGGIALYPGDDPGALGARIDAAVARSSTTFADDVPVALRPEAIARRWARLAEEAR